MSESIDIPGYRIIRELGSGGMAKVYLAVQESFGREVALKVMSPLLRLDPSFSGRFKREAHIVAQMYHASIVPVFEVGEHGDYHYLAMEYLPGGDLKQRLQSGITPQLACHVCFAIASALDSAHRKGFVHRDIKPENILFREDDTPVLTDFGIARAIDTGSSMTRTGVLVGTPTYMSPEQVEGLELDGRSDLYALGIVFYEMLTGSAPFRAESTISVAVKQLNEALPPLPPDYALYQPFLDRLTAKDREQRFASGAEVAHALSALGVVEAGSAPPRMTSPAVTEPTVFVVSTPRRRRRPRWLLLSGSAAALLLAGVALFLVQQEVPQARPSPSELPPRLEPLDASALPENQRELLARAEMQTQANDFAGAEESYLELLTLDSGSPLARAGLDHLAALHLAGARGALQQGSLEQARRDLMAALRLAPDHGDISALQADLQSALADREDAAAVEPPESAPVVVEQRTLSQQLLQQREQRERERRSRIQMLLGEAEAAVARAHWLEPYKKSAVDRYNTVLAIDPGNDAAVNGLHQVAAALIAVWEQALDSGDMDAARRSLMDARRVMPSHPQLAAIDQQLQLQRRQEARANRLVARGNSYLQRQPMTLRLVLAATRHYDEAQQLAPQVTALETFKTSIQEALATVARTELRNSDPADAQKVIDYARQRDWMTADLQLIEGTIQRQSAAE